MVFHLTYKVAELTRGLHLEAFALLKSGHLIQAPFYEVYCFQIATYVHVHVNSICDNVYIMCVSWFQVSSLSLGLSQETMNQVMGAVGLTSVMGDR